MIIVPDRLAVFFIFSWWEDLHISPKIFQTSLCSGGWESTYHVLVPGLHVFKYCITLLILELSISLMLGL